MSLGYRREIDGLRAVAVLPVILFHAGFSLWSGGFIGVDVFFVISGYLITGILIADLDRGQFSILRFYERRARRILPALFVVILACLPFAWAWMMPAQLQNFGQSIVATMLFASNVLFWMESGYFETAAEQKPLLHTWSLAVEEQYYVVFPLLLLALWRIGHRGLIWCLIALALLSLGLSEWLARRTPEANFFLAPSRVWELLAGSLCAFVMANRGPWKSDLLSCAGLAMIAASVFLFDKTTPFPSLYALLPVGGTVMFILFGGAGSLGARMLSVRPVVAIGLISYSAYLWHQPLFAFARIRSLTTPDPWLMAALAVAALGLGALSWRFIEQPFRGKAPLLLPSRRGIFAGAAIGVAASVAMGSAGHLTRGFPDRLDPITQSYAAKAENTDPERGACLFGGRRGLPDHPVAACTQFMPEGRIDVGFMGDSHIFTLAPVTQAALLERDIASYAVTSIGCVSLRGFTRTRLEGCDQYSREMTAFLKERGVKVLVLGARFPFYLEGDRFDNGEGGHEYGLPGAIDLTQMPLTAARGDTARKARVAEAYRTQIEALAEDFQLVLIYPIPEAGWDVPQMAARQSLLVGGSRELDISTAHAQYTARTAATVAAFDAVDSPNIYRVRPDQVFCNMPGQPGRCVNASGETLYYQDDDHLSGAGAALLTEALLPEIQAALNQAEAR